MHCMPFKSFQNPPSINFTSKLRQMASQSLQELASLLPGGTYISFAVLAQLTTNTTEMANRLQSPECQCSSSGAVASPSCSSAYVCGAGYYQMSVALVAVAVVVVWTLAWYGADLQSKKDTVVNVSAKKQKQATMRRGNSVAAAAAAVDLGPQDHEITLDTTLQTDTPQAAALANLEQTNTSKTGNTVSKITAAATGSSSSSSSAVHPAFVAAVHAMSGAELRRKYAELVVHQFIRSVGGVLIFLVLALFTPPISTCLLPPCQIPPVVCTVVPLLVSFAVSAFVAVKDQFVHRLVFAVDYVIHPADREPGKWTILTSGAKLLKEEAALLPIQQGMAAAV